MRLLASTVARATAGRLVGDDVAVDGATHDSRRVRGGELFVPIVAVRDGHDFVPDAVAAGAAAYLTARPARIDTAAPAIEVGDTQAALLDLGRHARSIVPDLVVGITGSVGKTTVKDLTAAALAATLVTTASTRSFNNELGVPLTLLGASALTEAVVVEMGSRGPGHIALLCDVARPTIGVVTAVALAHTELFGSIDAVAAAKGELVEALPGNGVAVLNADDPRVDAMAGRTEARVVRYGTSRGDVRASDVSLDDELRPSFRVESEWGSAAVTLSLRGMHQVGNALAALAVAVVAGVPLVDASAALVSATGSPWRMQLHSTPSGARVLDDSYHANPTSMTAALRALAALPAARRVAVLGIMAELGADAEVEHHRIGDIARDLGIRVVAVGVNGYGGDVVPDIEAAVAAVGDIDADDAVLVKGSRVAGLERLVERILDEGDRAS